MKKIISIANLIDKIIQQVSIIARWSVLLMLGLGFWNVLGRYLGLLIGFNLSSNRFIEGQWYLFDIIFLLGLGWTLQTNSHVRVDILQGGWGTKRKAKLEFLGTLILLLPFSIGVMAISIEPAFESWRILESSPDPNGLSRYWIKTLIPLSFFLLSLQGISNAIHNWMKIKKLTHISQKTLNKEKSFARD